MRPPVCSASRSASVSRRLLRLPLCRLGALVGVSGPLVGVSGPLIGIDPFGVQFLEGEEASAVGVADDHLRAGQVEADAQTWADETVYLANAHQDFAPPQEDVQVIVLGVVKVVFLDAVVVVEGELIHHLSCRVVRREDLEGDGDGDAAFLPLLVRAAVPLGLPKTTITSGAFRISGCPSTGYHRWLPATNTSRTAWNKADRLPYSTTIHRSCFELSDRGSPSSSGYAIGPTGAGGGGTIRLMSISPSSGETAPGYRARPCNRNRSFAPISRDRRRHRVGQGGPGTLPPPCLPRLPALATTSEVANPDLTIPGDEFNFAT